MSNNLPLQPLTIGLVCEGDASVSETAFSGTALKIYESLKAHGHHVIPVDATLHGLPKVLSAGFGFSRDRLRWRSFYRYGRFAATKRTSAAKKSLGNRTTDILLQIGATYAPPTSGTTPYALYCDWNMALNLQEGEQTYGKSLGLNPTELRRINTAHAEVYRRAGMIFTISKRLSHSFEDLYQVPPERVQTAYAGPNFDTDLIDKTLLKPKTKAAPTILFIAKEVRRKGGDLVAKAFVQVKAKYPKARLLFAGTRSLPGEFNAIEGIEHLGVLDKAQPQQLQRLMDAFHQADLLVLPTRHDPFPTVIREAMFFRLPCIATNIWAMPEMIEDGVTGFLIPVDDAAALASRIITLFESESLRTQMGSAARRRAEALFSWDAVGRVLSDGLKRCYLEY